MKVDIIVTHWDRNIDPEFISLRGGTEKDLIYDLCEESEGIMYALGEDNEFLNNQVSGEYTRGELLDDIKFNTLIDFLDDLNCSSDYSFKVKN